MRPADNRERCFEARVRLMKLPTRSLLTHCNHDRNYGYNIKQSIDLPLHRIVPEHRSPECAAIQYPKGMPTVGLACRAR